MLTSISAPDVLSDLDQFDTIIDARSPAEFAEDRVPGLRYDGSTVYPPDTALWG